MAVFFALKLQVCQSRGSFAFRGIVCFYFLPLPQNKAMEGRGGEEEDVVVGVVLHICVVWFLPAL